MTTAVKIIESINNLLPEVGTGTLSIQIGDLLEGTKVTYVKCNDKLLICEENSSDYLRVTSDVYEIIENKVDISDSDYDKVLG